MSSFAWQSNKAILFYFTQNYISEIWFRTSAEAGLSAPERGAVLSRWLISPGQPFPSLASSFSGLCWPLAGLLLNVCAELFISDLIYPQSARDARKFPRPSTNGAIRKRKFMSELISGHIFVSLDWKGLSSFISFHSFHSLQPFSPVHYTVMNSFGNSGNRWMCPHHSACSSTCDQCGICGLHSLTNPKTSLSSPALGPEIVKQLSWKSSEKSFSFFFIL